MESMNVTGLDIDFSLGNTLGYPAVTCNEKRYVVNARADTMVNDEALQEEYKDLLKEHQEEEDIEKSAGFPTFT